MLQLYLESDWKCAVPSYRSIVWWDCILSSASLFLFCLPFHYMTRIFLLQKVCPVYGLRFNILLLCCNLHPTRCFSLNLNDSQHKSYIHYMYLPLFSTLICFSDLYITHVLIHLSCVTHATELFLCLVMFYPCKLTISHLQWYFYSTTADQ